jgi:hypothetical protein
MDGFGDGVEGAVLPKISIDLWFNVEVADRVVN